MIWNSIKNSGALEFISAFFKAQQMINTRGRLAPPPPCVQMDFMPKFEANAKYNNINHV